jgi:hypothetical protein
MGDKKKIKKNFKNYFSKQLFLFLKKSFKIVFKGVLMKKTEPNPQFYADLNESVHFE